MPGSIIKVNLDELSSAAERLKREAANLEAAAEASDRSLESLRSMESVRLGKIITAWDELRAALKKNVEHVLEIADAEVEAERAFRIADGQD